MKAIDALLSAGARIAGVFALVDREEGGRDTIEKAGYEVIAVTRRQELIPLVL